MSKILINHVKRAVCAVYGIEVRDLDRQDRRRRFAAARQMAMACALNLTGQSRVVIARSFAGRDESTVRHAIETVSALVERYPREAETAAEVARLAGWYAAGNYAEAPQFSRSADLEVVPDGEIRAMRDLPAMMIAQRVGVPVTEVSRVLGAG
jgi:hypothetical protein